MHKKKLQKRIFYAVLENIIVFNYIRIIFIVTNYSTDHFNYNFLCRQKNYCFKNITYSSKNTMMRLKTK